MAYWLDYVGKLTGEQVKAGGYDGCIRYIDEPNRLGNKHTNKSEYNSLLAAGRKVRLVFEVTTTEASGGFAQGVAYAKRAKAGADYLGYTGVIYFCKDEPNDKPTTSVHVDYIRGAASVLGWDRTGAYGFSSFMDAVHAGTPCQHFWQCGSRSVLRPFAQIWQDNNWRGTVAGVPVDRNLIVQDIDSGDDMSATDAYNGVAQLLKDVDNGSAPDLRAILVGVVREGAYNAFAAVTKDMASGTAGDLADAWSKLAAGHALSDSEMTSLASAVANHFVDGLKKSFTP